MSIFMFCPNFYVVKFFGHNLYVVTIYVLLQFVFCQIHRFSHFDVITISVSLLQVVYQNLCFILLAFHHNICSQFVFHQYLCFIKNCISSLFVFYYNLCFTTFFTKYWHQQTYQWTNRLLELLRAASNPVFSIQGTTYTVRPWIFSASA